MSDQFRFRRAIAFLQESGAEINVNSSWMDLGCHQGQFLRMLISMFGVRPTGSDVWSPSLKGQNDSDWTYVQADYANGLPEFEADFISAFEVIEHIIDTDRFVRETFDRLKPGGWLLLSTPNINSLRNRIGVPLGSYPVGLEYKTIIHHVRLYNPDCLRRQLAEHGFSHIRMRGVSFLPLSTSVGESTASQVLANWLPQLCNNFLAVAQKPMLLAENATARPGPRSGTIETLSPPPRVLGRENPCVNG